MGLEGFTAQQKEVDRLLNERPPHRGTRCELTCSLDKYLRDYMKDNPGATAGNFISHLYEICYFDENRTRLL